MILLRLYIYTLTVYDWAMPSRKVNSPNNNPRTISALFWNLLMRLIAIKHDIMYIHKVSFHTHNNIYTSYTGVKLLTNSPTYFMIVLFTRSKKEGSIGLLASPSTISKPWWCFYQKANCYVCMYVNQYMFVAL